MNTTPQNTGGTARSSSDTDKARDAAADLGNEARDKARSLGENVAGQAREQADAAKAGAAEEISSVSKALRRASEELRDGSPQERTFGAAADAIAELADSVRDRDLGQMVDELSGFARRNPVGFLGGAALLGFAGVRLAKASRRARDGDDADHSGQYIHQASTPAAPRSPTASPAGTTGGPGTATTRTGETS